MSSDSVADDLVVSPSIFDIFDTDTNLEENGKWFYDIGGEGSGISVKVRRFSSKRVQDLYNRLQLANRKLAKNGKFPDDVAKAMLNRILGEAVVVDWNGIRGADGQPLEYASDVAVALFDKLPNFALVVFNLSNALTNWRKEEVEDSAGN